MNKLLLNAKKIIITDLTRFVNREILCTAGIDTDTGACIRPMPYLNANRCKELNMLPGAILSAEFTTPADLESPHIEDMYYQNLSLQRRHCTSDEFREVLYNSSTHSIEDGFEVPLDGRQKYIPREAAPARSILTIAVDPQSIQVVQDRFEPSKIKAHIQDRSGKKYSFLSITDVGFHSYAENHYKEAGNYAYINSLLHRQKEIFVRIGLSRYYMASNGRAGFWIQVNGIYSFPEYFSEARRYE